MTLSLRATVLFLLTLAAYSQTPPGHFAIEWETNSSVVRLVGPVPAEIRAATQDKLQELFPVTVESKDVLSALDLPAMAGNYTASSNGIVFQPQFRFQPGVSYRASFSPAKISSVFRLPIARSERNTVVSQVYPTSDILPQNLLKFYLYFSAPMSRGHIYEHIHLLDQDAKPIELPFLEIDEELWNREMTRLTLFLDPGRIKRGVRPLEEVGPALLPERDYTLVIDENWLDAQGMPLKTSFRKKFHVTPPDREAPDPTLWKISSPRAGTREPLTITFTDPMDQALALRLIAVESLAGQKSVEEHETKWLFTPEQSWKPGEYRILVQSTIEDLAGNNIGKPFEVDLQQGSRTREAGVVELHTRVTK